MGIVNKDNALYMATGIDNSGLYSGRKEAIGIIRAMAGEITSFDVFGGIGISAGIAFAKAAKGAYDFEKQFQQSMKEVATLSSGIKGNLTDYMNQILDITKEIPIQANDAAKALYQIVSAGHDGADGMKILKVSAKAAIGGVTDTATAADAVTTVLNAYKMNAGEAERVSNQLFKTVKLGKTDFGQLGKSIAQAAPIAASFGIDLKEVLAAVASITKQGVPTAEAMTKIRAAILGTANHLGDAAFKGRTFQEALQLIYNEANGSSTKMKELLGTDEALQAALMVTGDNAKGAAADLNEVGNSAGAAKAAFEEMASSTQNQLQLLQNNITDFLRPMGEAIIKEVSDIASSFNEAFANGDVQKSMETLGSLIVVVTGALIGYKGSIIATTAAKTAYHTITTWITKQKVLEAANLVLTKGLYAAEATMVAKNTGMHVLLAKALKAQSAASVKATAAMMTNPYVLAGVAVAALGYTVYKLATAETVAERAVRKHREEQEKFKSAADERNQKIEELIRIIQDETETEYAKIKAYEELQRYSPALTAAYNREQLATLELAKSQKVLNEERDKENYNNIIKNIEKYESIIDGLKKKLNDKSYNQSIISEQIEEALKSLDIWKKDLSEYNRIKKQAEEDAKPVEVKLLEAQADLKQIEHEFEKAKQKLEDEQKRLGITEIVIPLKVEEQEYTGFNNIDVGVLSDFNYWQDKYKEKQQDVTNLLSQQTGTSKEEQETYKQAYDKAKANWKAKIKALEDAKKGTKTEYEKAKTALDEAEKKYRDLGGVTDLGSINSLREEQEKYALLLDKQALDRKRQAEDLENQLSQSKIDAMSDGFEKEQAQRKLNNEKEIQELERRKQDYIRSYIQAEKDKFDAGQELKAKQIKGYRKQTFNAATVKVDASRYDEVIDNTKTKQVLNEWEQREASMNEYLLAYGTFSQKKEAIDKKYRDAIDKEADLGKKNILQKEWEEAIQGIDMSELKQSMDWEQVFGNLDKVSTSTLKKLKTNLKDFISNQKDLSPENLKELVDAIERIDDKVSERNPFEAMSVSFKSLKSATDTQREAQEAYNKALKEGTDEEQKNAKATLERAKNNKQKALYEANIALHKGVDEIGQYVEAGNQVIGIMETLGIKTPEWLEGTMSGFGEMLNGLEKIDLMKPMSIVTGGLQTVKGALTSIISLGGLIPGFGGADYSQYNKMVAQYEQLSTIWDELIDKKKEYIDISYGSEALKAGQEALDIIDKSQQAQRNLARARASSGASAGSHSIAYRQNKGLGGYAPELYKYVSQNGNYNDITSALLGASEEQLKKVREQMPEMWAGLDGDFREHLDNIISGAEQTKEVLERMKEAVTGMSFDEFRSGYVDLLSDLDSTNEDFADNFEKYLQNAIFESLLANKYKDQVQDLYDTWSEYGKDGLSSDEAQKLRDMQKQLTESMIAERDKLMADFGWESDSESSRKASQKGIATASQDSVDENNGRLAVMQTYTNSINEKVTSMDERLYYMSGYAPYLTYLPNIERNTGSIEDCCNAIVSRLSNIDNNTSRLEAIENAIVFMKNDINTMLIKGLKLSKN